MMTLTSPGTDLPDELWTPKQYAAYIGVTVQAAAAQRHRGTGPRYVRIGARTIRYRPADVIAWLEQNVETQTTGAA